jgi:hypothetical protein
VLDVFQLQYLLALLLVLGASFVLKFVVYGRVFGAKTNANARSESNGA